MYGLVCLCGWQVGSAIIIYAVIKRTRCNVLVFDFRTNISLALLLFTFAQIRGKSIDKFCLCAVNLTSACSLSRLYVNTWR